jgi:RecB family exonuclease
MAERFSYSKIDTYSQCGFKYKLRYIDKHYVTGDSIATELGTVIHETEETIAKAIKAGEAINYVALKNRIILSMIELEHKYPEAWSALDKSNRNYKEKIYEYLRGGIYRLENFLMANGHLRIVDTEKEFEFEFEGITFHGFIDRILFDTRTNKYIVQDIKTYAVPVEKKNLDAPLQFVVYTYAMKQLYGLINEQVECSYDLPFCNIIQKVDNADYMLKGTEKLKKLLAAISENDFTPKPSPLCHWCEYSPTNPNQDPKAKNLCPYHSLWTRENKTQAVASHWAGLENHEIVLFEYIKCQNTATPETVNYCPNIV